MILAALFALGALKKERKNNCLPICRSQKMKNSGCLSFCVSSMLCVEDHIGLFLFNAMDMLWRLSQNSSEGQRKSNLVDFWLGCYEAS